METGEFTLHWYPGHMAKARRALSTLIRQVDFVVEVADARAPETTRNTDLNPLIADRPRLLLLSKEDLAEPGATRAWMKAFQERGMPVLSLSLGDARSARAVRRAIGGIAVKLQARNAPPRTLRNIPGVSLPKHSGPVLRGMVVGMPNTGKSTLIRALGGKGVPVGAKAGVTRGVQWIGVGDGIQLLDTPGLLWPHSESGTGALKLAWLGCAGDAAYDPEEAAYALVVWITARSPRLLSEHYALEEEVGGDPAETLSHIARRRGRFDGRGGPDVRQAALTLIADFREGRMGRFTLDPPPEGERDNAR